jgi:hypothetical protein
MKLINILLPAAAVFIFIAPAFAELSLPVDMDFEDEFLFPVGLLKKSKDLPVFIDPLDAEPGIEIVEEPQTAGNKVLVVRSNGSSRINRLKLMLPPMAGPFEYQFRCKVDGKFVPGTRSLLTFYALNEYDRPSAVLSAYGPANTVYAMVDQKLKSIGRDFNEWRTVKVVINTDGKAEIPDTYSLYIDGEEVLNGVPMERDFDSPLNIAEIALDFDDANSISNLKFLIDDIKIGSPTIDNP